MTASDTGSLEVRASHEQIPDQVLYWVGLYLVTLDYGGPEEGGHWYPTGELETDPALYRILGHPPRAFFDRDDAHLFMGELEVNLALLNAGRPHPQASNSKGSYELHVMHALSLPLAFPDTGPRYE
ncbi:MAG: hypothetical protein ACRYHQ_26295 [Janthinobacterium lividum]